MEFLKALDTARKIKASLLCPDPVNARSIIDSVNNGKTKETNQNETNNNASQKKNKGKKTTDSEPKPTQKAQSGVDQSEGENGTMNGGI